MTKKFINTVALLFVTALAAAAQQHMLTWNPNPPAEKVSEYRIYRMQPAPAKPVLLQTIKAPAVTTTLTLTGGEILVITAVNASGESQWSQPFTAPQPLPLPSAPAGFKIEYQVTLKLTPSQ